MKTRVRMGRPPLPDGEQRQVVSFRLHPDTLRILSRLARLGRTTRTKIVENAVQSLWDRHKETTTENDG